MLLFHDKELGNIAVTVNARSRQFVLRYKDGCTVQPVIPPYGNSDRWFIFRQAIELIDKVVDFCF